MKVLLLLVFCRFYVFVTSGVSIEFKNFSKRSKVPKLFFVLLLDKFLVLSVFNGEGHSERLPCVPTALKKSEIL